MEAQKKPVEGIKSPPIPVSYEDMSRERIKRFSDERKVGVYQDAIGGVLSRERLEEIFKSDIWKAAVGQEMEDAKRGWSDGARIASMSALYAGSLTDKERVAMADKIKELAPPELKNIGSPMDVNLMYFALKNLQKQA